MSHQPEEAKETYERKPPVEQTDIDRNRKTKLRFKTTIEYKADGQVDTKVGTIIDASMKMQIMLKQTLNTESLQQNLELLKDKHQLVKLHQINNQNILLRTVQQYTRIGAYFLVNTQNIDQYEESINVEVLTSFNSFTMPMACNAMLTEPYSYVTNIKSDLSNFADLNVQQLKYDRTNFKDYRDQDPESLMITEKLKHGLRSYMSDLKDEDMKVHISKLDLWAQILEMQMPSIRQKPELKDLALAKVDREKYQHILYTIRHQIYQQKTDHADPDITALRLIMHFAFTTAKLSMQSQNLLYLTLLRNDEDNLPWTQYEQYYTELGDTLASVRAKTFKFFLEYLETQAEQMGLSDFVETSLGIETGNLILDQGLVEQQETDLQPLALKVFELTLQNQHNQVTLEEQKDPDYKVDNTVVSKYINPQLKVILKDLMKKHKKRDSENSGVKDFVFNLQSCANVLYSQQSLDQLKGNLQKILENLAPQDAISLRSPFFIGYIHSSRTLLHQFSREFEANNRYQLFNYLNLQKNEYTESSARLGLLKQETNLFNFNTKSQQYNLIIESLSPRVILFKQILKDLNSYVPEKNVLRILLTDDSQINVNEDPLPTNTLKLIEYNAAIQNNLLEAIFQKNKVEFRKMKFIVPRPGLMLELFDLPQFIKQSQPRDEIGNFDRDNITKTQMGFGMVNWTLQESKLINLTLLHVLLFLFEIIIHFDLHKIYKNTNMSDQVFMQSLNDAADQLMKHDSSAIQKTLRLYLKINGISLRKGLVRTLFTRSIIEKTCNLLMGISYTLLANLDKQLAEYEKDKSDLTDNQTITIENLLVLQIHMKTITEIESHYEMPISRYKFTHHDSVNHERNLPSAVLIPDQLGISSILQVQIILNSIFMVQDHKLEDQFLKQAFRMFTDITDLIIPRKIMDNYKTTENLINVIGRKTATSKLKLQHLSVAVQLFTQTNEIIISAKTQGEDKQFSELIASTQYLQTQMYKQTLVEQIIDLQDYMINMNKLGTLPMLCLYWLNNIKYDTSIETKDQMYDLQRIMGFRQQNKLIQLKQQFYQNQIDLTNKTIRQMHKQNPPYNPNLGPFNILLNQYPMWVLRIQKSEDSFRTIITHNYINIETILKPVLSHARILLEQGADSYPNTEIVKHGIPVAFHQSLAPYDNNFAEFLQSGIDDIHEFIGQLNSYLAAQIDNQSPFNHLRNIDKLSLSILNPVTYSKQYQFPTLQHINIQQTMNLNNLINQLVFTKTATHKHRSRHFTTTNKILENLLHPQDLMNADTDLEIELKTDLNLISQYSNTVTHLVNNSPDFPSTELSKNEEFVKLLLKTFATRDSDTQDWLRQSRIIREKLYVDYVHRQQIFSDLQNEVDLIINLSMNKLHLIIKTLVQNPLSSKYGQTTQQRALWITLASHLENRYVKKAFKDSVYFGAIVNETIVKESEYGPQIDQAINQGDTMLIDTRLKQIKQQMLINISEKVMEQIQEYIIDELLPSSIRDFNRYTSDQYHNTNRLEQQLQDDEDTAPESTLMVITQSIKTHKITKYLQNNRLLEENKIIDALVANLVKEIHTIPFQHPLNQQTVDPHILVDLQMLEYSKQRLGDFAKYSLKQFSHPWADSLIEFYHNINLWDSEEVSLELQMTRAVITTQIINYITVLQLRFQKVNLFEQVKDYKQYQELFQKLQEIQDLASSTVKNSRLDLISIVVTNVFLSTSYVLDSVTDLDNIHQVASFINLIVVNSTFDEYIHSLTRKNSKVGMLGNRMIQNTLVQQSELIEIQLNYSALKVVETQIHQGAQILRTLFPTQSKYSDESLMLLAHQKTQANTQLHWDTEITNLEIEVQKSKLYSNIYDYGSALLGCYSNQLHIYGQQTIKLYLQLSIRLSEKLRDSLFIGNDEYVLSLIRKPRHASSKWKELNKTFEELTKLIADIHSEQDGFYSMQGQNIFDQIHAMSVIWQELLNTKLEDFLIIPTSQTNLVGKRLKELVITRSYNQMQKQKDSYLKTNQNVSLFIQAIQENQLEFLMYPNDNIKQQSQVTVIQIETLNLEYVQWGLDKGIIIIWDGIQQVQYKATYYLNLSNLGTVLNSKHTKVQQFNIYLPFEETAFLSEGMGFNYNLSTEAIKLEQYSSVLRHINSLTGEDKIPEQASQNINFFLTMYLQSQYKTQQIIKQSNQDVSEEQKALTLRIASNINHEIQVAQRVAQNKSRKNAPKMTILQPEKIKPKTMKKLRKFQDNPKISLIFRKLQDIGIDKKSLQNKPGRKSKFIGRTLSYKDQLKKISKKHLKQKKTIQEEFDSTTVQLQIQGIQKFIENSEKQQLHDGENEKIPQQLKAALINNENGQIYSDLEDDSEMESESNYQDSEGSEQKSQDSKDIKNEANIIKTQSQVDNKLYELVQDLISNNSEESKEQKQYQNDDTSEKGSIDDESASNSPNSDNIDDVHSNHSEESRQIEQDIVNEKIDIGKRLLENHTIAYEQEKSIAARARLLLSQGQNIYQSRTEYNELQKATKDLDDYVKDNEREENQHSAVADSDSENMADEFINQLGEDPSFLAQNDPEFSNRNETELGQQEHIAILLQTQIESIKVTPEQLRKIIQKQNNVLKRYRALMKIDNDQFEITIQLLQEWKESGYDRNHFSYHLLENSSAFKKLEQGSEKLNMLQHRLAAIALNPEGNKEQDDIFTLQSSLIPYHHVVKHIAEVYKYNEINQETSKNLYNSTRQSLYDLIIHQRLAQIMKGKNITIENMEIAIKTSLEKTNVYKIVNTIQQDSQSQISDEEYFVNVTKIKDHLLEQIITGIKVDNEMLLIQEKHILFAILIKNLIQNPDQLIIIESIYIFYNHLQHDYDKIFIENVEDFKKVLENRNIIARGQFFKLQQTKLRELLFKLTKVQKNLQFTNHQMRILEELRNNLIEYNKILPTNRVREEDYITPHIFPYFGVFDPISEISTISEVFLYSLKQITLEQMHLQLAAKTGNLQHHSQNQEIQYNINRWTLLHRDSQELTYYFTVIGNNEDELLQTSLRYKYSRNINIGIFFQAQNIQQTLYSFLLTLENKLIIQQANSYINNLNVSNFKFPKRDSEENKLFRIGLVTSTVTDFIETMVLRNTKSNTDIYTQLQKMEKQLAIGEFTIQFKNYQDEQHTEVPSIDTYITSQKLWDVIIQYSLDQQALDKTILGTQKEIGELYDQISQNIQAPLEPGSDQEIRLQQIQANSLTLTSNFQQQVVNVQKLISATQDTVGTQLMTVQEYTEQRMNIKQIFDTELQLYNQMVDPFGNVDQNMREDGEIRQPNPNVAQPPPPPPAGDAIAAGFLVPRAFPAYFTLSKYKTYDMFVEHKPQKIDAASCFDWLKSKSSSFMDTQQWYRAHGYNVIGYRGHLTIKSHGATVVGYLDYDYSGTNRNDTVSFTGNKSKHDWAFVCHSMDGSQIFSGDPISKKKRNGELYKTRGSKISGNDLTIVKTQMNSTPTSSMSWAAAAGKNIVGHMKAYNFFGGLDTKRNDTKHNIKILSTKGGDFIPVYVSLQFIVAKTEKTLLLKNLKIQNLTVREAHAVEGSITQLVNQAPNVVLTSIYGHNSINNETPVSVIARSTQKWAQSLASFQLLIAEMALSGAQIQNNTVKQVLKNQLGQLFESMFKHAAARTGATDVIINSFIKRQMKKVQGMFTLYAHLDKRDPKIDRFAEASSFTKELITVFQQFQEEPHKQIVIQFYSALYTKYKRFKNKGYSDTLARAMLEGIAKSIPKLSTKTIPLRKVRQKGKGKRKIVTHANKFMTEYGLQKQEA